MNINVQLYSESARHRNLSKWREISKVGTQIHKFSESHSELKPEINYFQFYFIYRDYSLLKQISLKQKTLFSIQEYFIRKIFFSQKKLINFENNLNYKKLYQKKDKINFWNLLKFRSQVLKNENTGSCAQNWEDGES